MALGSLIIQNRVPFPDRELVEQITENPYLQYFIGLPGYQNTLLFDASTLVLFRKRITVNMLNEANEYMLAHKDDDREASPSSGNGRNENAGPESEEPNIGNKNIGITPTGLKWNDFSAVTSVVMAWDVSLLSWKKHNLRPSRYLYSCRICLRFRSEYFLHLSGYTANIWYGAGNTS